MNVFLCMLQVVGVVFAEDGDTGLGGQIQYRIVPSWGSDRFFINRNNGVVSLNAALNYEDVSEQDLLLLKISNHTSYCLSKALGKYATMISKFVNF